MEVLGCVGRRTVEVSGRLAGWASAIGALKAKAPAQKRMGFTVKKTARAALAQLLGSYFTLRNQAQTADQAVQAISEASLRFQVLQSAQNQVLIQQNQQILNQNARLIELMEIQARKR